MTTKTDYFFLFRGPKVEEIFIKKHGIYGAFDVAAIFFHYKRLGERVLSLKRFFVQWCLGVVPIWKIEKRESSLSLLQRLPNWQWIETCTRLKCLGKSLIMARVTECFLNMDIFNAMMLNWRRLSSIYIGACWFNFFLLFRLIFMHVRYSIRIVFCRSKADSDRWYNTRRLCRWR